ncbi:MAG: hypothetical protein JW927_13395 [Deltaproteobacteria bacterium]|nr:hypothetical protein [Deltaproteobacteria bacterium]
MDTEKRIISIINEKGPLTGSELVSYFKKEPLMVLRACKLAPALKVQTIGTRYLRLDRRIEGYARLSPSIMREFLTYSVIGLVDDPARLKEKAGLLTERIEKISRGKRDLAYNIVSSLMSRLEYGTKEKACFIITGDIVFNMAHDVPRPERSTKKLVQGSDMDIVVIIRDEHADSIMERLDQEIYKEKCNLLISPYTKEEIDYIVKTVSTVKEQLKFDTFKHMVACKILDEGRFLFGNKELFNQIKQLLIEKGIGEKIREMEKKALEFRQRAEEKLLGDNPEQALHDDEFLFYPVEESEEFE